MYNPIIGANEEYEGHVPVMTDDPTMARTAKLQTTYEDLRTDLLEEVNAVDARIIQPAMDAKACLQPLKKVIKKREDKKVGINSDLHLSTTDGPSWTLRNIRRGLTMVGRRPSARRETMPL